ncbi:response regulator transcription factor [Sandarakinorhabdus limnophila]|uniref:response regulator transcription factor n=1 Tax=Sandarakinorhabdus limnophila TaxID=210512 RepID=UPI0026F01317|nr:response regulator transcription factor [Sandarakinorhabdus limnophila]MCM0032390.1 response regulator transcription factor [Sandarakinorhabdus limnophila]
MTETPISQVCIVDDDSDFVEFLGQYLEVRGLAASGFATAEALLKSSDLAKFDFFILDLGLPGIDGVDLITLLRARTNAGILVISGRMGPDAFNSALSAGADMFINKPIRFDQVYNAIASVCRRMSLRIVGNSPWRLLVKRSELVAPDGGTVSLTPVELKILHRLFDDPSQVVTRQQLSDAAGIITSGDDRNLDSAIFRLRRKIEKEASQPSPLKTVHGLGYQIFKPVEIIHS